MKRSRFTSSARPREIAQVVGTMKAANTVKVPSEPMNPLSARISR